MNTSGKKLKSLRLKKGETVTDVAKALNVSISTISQYENGLRTPNDEMKKALAKHFNRTVQFIFFTE